MGAYTVRLNAGARRQLRALGEPIRSRIREALRGLETDPRPAGAKLLSGSRAERIWRVRVGDYRVLYEINDDQLVVLVIRLGHRGQVYRLR